MTPLALGGAQLARIAAARAGQAVHAGQVAGVGQLPGQADRRVQAVPELLDQRRGGHGHAACPPADHLAGGQGGQRPGVAGSSAGPIPASAQAARALGCASSDRDHGQQGRALQERQPPGAEVVEQRAEALRPDRDLRVQPPGRVQVERRRPWEVAGGRRGLRLSRHRTCRRSRSPRPARQRRRPRRLGRRDVVLLSRSAVSPAGRSSSSVAFSGMSCSLVSALA